MTTPQPSQPDAAATLLAVNRRRRSIRRWIVVATLPLTLAALLFVVKLLSMYAFAHTSISSFVSGAYAESESAARGQDVANWFEPFAAPYNIGTALAGADELAASRSELERALPLAQGLQVCPVMINLSLVIERQGDTAQADGDAAKAAELYGEALEITVETPEECRSDEAQQQSPQPNRDMSDTLDENQQRQQEKQRQSQQPPDQPQQPDQTDQSEQPQTPQDKLDDIEDRLNQGAQEREEQLGGGQGDEGTGGGTDKPW